MLHSKTILSSQTGASKLFCIGISLFWSRCRTWGTFTHFPNVTQHKRRFTNDFLSLTHYSSTVLIFPMLLSRKGDSPILRLTHYFIMCTHFPNDEWWVGCQFGGTGWGGRELLVCLSNKGMHNCVNLDVKWFNWGEEKENRCMQSWLISANPDPSICHSSPYRTIPYHTVPYHTTHLHYMPSTRPLICCVWVSIWEPW